MPNLDQYNSLIRAFVTFGSGVLVTLGILSQADMQTVLGGLKDMGEGIGMFMKGAGAIIPIAAAAWGVWRSSLKSQVQTVAAAAPAELAVAVAKVKPVEMVAAVNAIPDVKGVVTQDTPTGRALAGAIPSATVASAGTMQAQTVAQS